MKHGRLQEDEKVRMEVYAWKRIEENRRKVYYMNNGGGLFDLYIL